MAPPAARKPNPDLPHVFLDCHIGHTDRTGRIVIELFADKVPQTCANFKLLCTGERGQTPFVSRRTGKPINLSYKDSAFHRVIEGFMIQGGDMEVGSGVGGVIAKATSAEETLPDEPAGLKMKHDRPGLLSMANRGAGTARSQFFILTEAAPHLDGKHVIFGEVIHGLDLVKEIEAVPTHPDTDCPLKPVTIVNCGELELVRKTKRKPSSSARGRSESRSRSRSRSRDRVRRKRHHSDDSASESDTDSSDDQGRRKRRSKHKSSRRDKKKAKKEKKGKKRSRRSLSRSRSRSRSASPPPSVAATESTGGSIIQSVYARLFGDPDSDRRLPNAPLMDPAVQAGVQRNDRDGREVKGRGRLRYGNAAPPQRPPQGRDGYDGGYRPNPRPGHVASPPHGSSAGRPRDEAGYGGKWAQLSTMSLREAVGETRDRAREEEEGRDRRAKSASPRERRRSVSRGRSRSRSQHSRSRSRSMSRSISRSRSRSRSGSEEREEGEYRPRASARDRSASRSPSPSPSSGSREEPSAPKPSESDDEK